MKGLLKRWLTLKWMEQDHSELCDAYRMTFSTVYGQMVLQHLLDSVYCTTYEGGDPDEAMHHNGRRSVVHDILINIDLAEDPQKYTVLTKEERSV